MTQTSQGAHAQIACTRCHVQTGIAPRVVYGYHLLFGMALRLGTTDGVPVAGVTDSACLSCHEEVMSSTLTANGLRIEHAKCSLGRMCTDCHSTTAHGTAVTWPETSDMNMCLECHAVLAPVEGLEACETCHVAKSQRERLQTGEWKVTHGANWQKTHGMGTLKTCAACHADGYCAKCHEISLPHDPDNYIHTHPLEAATHPKACATCHAKTFCSDCHGLQMPHPVAFVPLHSSVVRKQGAALCRRCHLQEDCNLCHERHVHPGGAKLPPGGGLQ